MAASYQLSHIGDSGQDRIQNQGNDKSADALDQIGGNAGQSGWQPIKESFAQAVASRYQKYIHNSSGSHCRKAQAGMPACLLENQTAAQGYKSFDKEGDGSVHKIPAQQICQRRANSSS